MADNNQTPSSTTPISIPGQTTSQSTDLSEIIKSTLSASPMATDSFPNPNSTSTTSSTSTTTSTNSNLPTLKGEALNFVVNFNKQNFDVKELGTDNTVGELRVVVAKLTKVDPPLQKLMLKGLLKDDNASLVKKRRYDD